MSMYRPSPHRAQSSITYSGLTPIKTSMESLASPFSSAQGRTIGAKQRYFVLEQYGPELDVARGNGGQGGSVLSFLQPTVHLQLVHVLPQLHLPSPSGLTLHLHVASTSATPNIDESIWNHLFARHLLATATSVPLVPDSHGPFGGLPIAAHLELRVDTDRARWWAAWRVDPLEGRVEKWVDVESRHAVDDASGYVTPTPTRQSAAALLNVLTVSPTPPSGKGEKTMSVESPRTSTPIVIARTIDATSPSSPASRRAVTDQEFFPHISEIHAAPVGIAGDTMIPAQPFFSHTRRPMQSSSASRWYPAATPPVSLPLSPPAYVHIPAGSAGTPLNKSRRTSLRILIPTLSAVVQTTTPLVDNHQSNDIEVITGLDPPLSLDAPSSARLSPVPLSACLSPDVRFATRPFSDFSGGSMTGDEHDDIEEATIQTVSSPMREDVSGGVWPFIVPFVRDQPGSSPFVTDHPTSPISPEAPTQEEPPVAQHRPTTSAPTIPLPPVPTSSGGRTPTPMAPASAPTTTSAHQTLAPASPGSGTASPEQVSKSVAALKARQDISFLAASEKLALKSTSSLRRPSARPRPMQAPSTMPALDERPAVSRKIDKHASLFNGTSFDDEVSLLPFSSPAQSKQLDFAPSPRVGLPPRASRMTSFSEQETLPPLHRSSIVMHTPGPVPSPLQSEQTPRPVPTATATAHESSLSLASATSSTANTNVKDSPKRPLKRISSSIGFFSLGDVDSSPPLNVPREKRATTMGSSLSADGGGYPCIVIYPAAKKTSSDSAPNEDSASVAPVPAPVSIEVYSYAYPVIVLYRPQRTAAASHGDIPESVAPTSIAIPVDRVSYPLLRIYRARAVVDVEIRVHSTAYPDLVIYTPTMVVQRSNAVEVKSVQPIPVLLHRFAYPDITLYPRLAPLPALEHLAEPTYPSSPSVESAAAPLPMALGIVRFQYPAVMIYRPIARRPAPIKATAERQVTEVAHADPITIHIASSTYPYLTIYAPVPRSPSPIEIAIASKMYPLLEIYPRSADLVVTRPESSRVKYQISSRPTLANITTDVPSTRFNVKQADSSPELLITPQQMSRSSPSRRHPPKVLPPQKPAPSMALPPTPPSVTASAYQQPLANRAVRFAASPSSPDTPSTADTDGTKSPPVAQSPLSPHKRSRSSTLIAERTRALLAQASPPPVVRRDRSSTLIRPLSAAGIFPLPPVRSGSPRPS